MSKANLDLDIVAYQVASACEGKYYKYKGEEWDSKVELNKVLKKDGVDQMSIEPMSRPEKWSRVEYSLNSCMEDLIEAVETYEYTGWLTGKSNFRYKVATILPYKGNRAKVAKPYHLDQCRQHLVDEYGAKVSVGMEADDAIGLNHNAEDGDVIATLDKDLDCIPGKHYNWTKDKWYEVSLVEANRNFYKQMLTGDTTDNILGLYGVGAKSAMCKKIDKMETHHDMQELVYSEYCSRFGSYANMFHSENAKLLWILQQRAIPESDLGEYWNA